VRGRGAYVETNHHDGYNARLDGLPGKASNQICRIAEGSWFTGRGNVARKLLTSRRITTSL